MPKKTTKKPSRRPTKRAPLTIGGRKGTAAPDDPAVLARIEEDLVAAIADAEGALKQLRERLEELRAERAGATRAKRTVTGPSNPRLD
jgi:hypothetical protein